MSDIYNLLDEVQQYPGMDSAYVEKMMHKIPDVKVVSREKYLLAKAYKKTVLDIGCSGEMGKAIRKVAKRHYGIDIEPNLFDKDYLQIDIDSADEFPFINDLDVVIAGEIIEHLSNAGHFLDLLSIYKCDIILTTPNAYGSTGQHYNRKGIESVNKDHVAWYSWYTLKNLVERHGYVVKEWYWYNGKPYIAEGLIFCLKS